jgi:hypothetical protein
VAAQLVASQKGLSSIKLVTCLMTLSVSRLHRMIKEYEDVRKMGIGRGKRSTRRKTVLVPLTMANKGTIRQV